MATIAGSLGGGNGHGARFILKLAYVD
jgi:hypothetical protein